MDKRQFKVKFLDGKTWLDLYSSEEDLNDKTPILTEDGDPFDDLDEGTPVFDLKTARKEAQKQFFDKDATMRKARLWIISNGEIAFIKGASKPFEVSEDIFGEAKEAMPACSDSVVTRNADGSLTRKNVVRHGHDFGSSSRDDMSAITASMSLGVIV